MSGWLFLSVAVLGMGLVANAAQPRRGPFTLLPSWIAAFLTTDLAGFHIGLASLASAAFIAAGALDHPAGRVAGGLVLVSVLWVILIWRHSLKAPETAEAVADELGFHPVAALPSALLWKPFSRRRPGVEVLRDIEFYKAGGQSLKLDVYRSESNTQPRPALIYLHGGGWVVGDKRDQGLPLCNHLATLGWVCVNANYRLSPAATYPEHVVDAKAAVAWTRRHAAAYGIDPSFIAIAGGSAGAHIAAMTALTPGDPVFQPGFEDDDTSLQATITCYGVYDLANRLGSHNPEFMSRFIGPMVLKASPKTELDRFVDASPLSHVHRVSMPWLILQGDADTLTPVADARHFYASLRAASSQLVAYAEFPRANHAFDVYYCHRALAAVRLASRFLVTSHRQAGVDGP